MIQQMLADLRPLRFSAMYDMSYSTKSALPSATISTMLTRGHKALFGRDLFCVLLACFSDTNSTSPLLIGDGKVDRAV